MPVVVTAAIALILLAVMSSIARTYKVFTGAVGIALVVIGWGLLQDGNIYGGGACLCFAAAFLAATFA